MIIPNNMISHVGKIFQGEYAIGAMPNPYIIDIGANVGGFAVWAHEYFEQPKIDCYEPIKENYEMLSDNANLNEIKNIIPLNDKETRVPYKIMSFDIEASSSHGDFPVPIKSYKKLTTNIILFSFS